MRPSQSNISVRVPGTKSSRADVFEDVVLFIDKLNIRSLLYYKTDFYHEKFAGFLVSR